MDSFHTILLADDSSVVRRSVRRSLEQAGWTVCGEAANGREAIEKANKFHPRVVILDLSMPEMNGLEAARQLKQAMPEIQSDLVHHARRRIPFKRSGLCWLRRRILEN